jgi:rare lipoprotein A (peptidoglycan hydrolase)
MKKLVCLVIFIYSFGSLSAQQDSAHTKNDTVSVKALGQDSFRVTGKAINGTAVLRAVKNGSKTATGEKLGNTGFTASTNKFKLNSWIRITNLKNKKTVLVRINDETSKRKNAPTIELSKAAGLVLDISSSENQSKIKIEQIELINLYPALNVSVDTVKPNTGPLTVVPAAVDTSTTPNTFKFTGKSIMGIASFYSSNLDGTKTATGERYRNHRLTAASNNFKLNTWVLVTNLGNKRSVIVRINDRMHPRMKKKGRVVDLSGDAAKTIDIIEDGLAKVKVEVIEFVHETAAQRDSLTNIADSVKAIDSLRLDSAKVTDNTLFGIASFYSLNLDGTKTATGETYRNNKLSAASNQFDLNSWVRITNLENNKTVILRINDRMHPRMKEKGRVLDLSRKAAQRLNFIKNGLAKVKVELVDKGTLN